MTELTTSAKQDGNHYVINGDRHPRGRAVGNEVDLSLGESGYWPRLWRKLSRTRRRQHFFADAHGLGICASSLAASLFRS